MKSFCSLQLQIALKVWSEKNCNIKIQTEKQKYLPFAMLEPYPYGEVKGKAAPKCATVAYWCFELKVTGETADTGGIFWPSAHCWHQEINLPCERRSPCTWRVKGILIPRERELSAEKAVINKTYYFGTSLLPQHKGCLGFLTNLSSQT